MTKAALGFFAGAPNAADEDPMSIPPNQLDGNVSYYDSPEGIADMESVSDIFNEIVGPMWQCAADDSRLGTSVDPVTHAEVKLETLAEVVAREERKVEHYGALDRRDDANRALGCIVVVNPDRKALARNARVRLARARSRVRRDQRNRPSIAPRRLAARRPSRRSSRRRRQVARVARGSPSPEPGPTELALKPSIARAS